MDRLNFAIPLYFDQSLSYLEMVANLADKMKRLEESTSTIIQQIGFDGDKVVIKGDLEVLGNLIATIVVDNAETANKLAQARSITLSGDIVGETTFDGSSDVIINTQVKDYLDTTAAQADKLATPRTFTLQGNVTGTGTFDGTGDVIINTHVSGGSTEINSTDGNFTVGAAGTGNLYVNGDYLYRDGSNDTYIIQDGRIKVDSDGNAATATTATKADKLTTPRNITLTGNATGSATFDGSSDISIDAQVSYAAEAGSTSTATNATNSTYSTHIGTDSAHPSIGTSSRPVYVNTAGTITPLSATVGSATQPVYMNAGTITAGTYSFSVLTQADYDGLTSKGANTLYFIKGE